MSLSSHLQELKKKHQNLSIQIEELTKDPSFDELAVKKLKQQKLRLKDRITQIELELDQSQTMAAE